MFCGFQDLNDLQTMGTGEGWKKDPVSYCVKFFLKKIQVCYYYASKKGIVDDELEKYSFSRALKEGIVEYDKFFCGRHYSPM